MKTSPKSIFCNGTLRWIAITIGILTAIGAFNHAKAETFEGIDVKVSGKGAPMIFIQNAGQ